MNRRDFVRQVAAQLRENNVRKPVLTPKRVFHISDDFGNSKDFIVRSVDKGVLFTIDDIDTIIDACIYVIQETLKRGEDISFQGFGTLGVRYRQPRATKSIETGEHIDIAGRYVPKFMSGKDLKLCARLYEAAQKEQNLIQSNDSGFDFSEEGE